MQKYSIADNKISSAIFGGFADIEYMLDFTRVTGVGIRKAGTKEEDIFEKMRKAFVSTVATTTEMIAKGVSNTVDWIKSIEWKFDPAVFFTVTATGVLLVVGGAIIGPVARFALWGLRALWTIPVVGKFLATSIGTLTVGTLIQWLVRGVVYISNFNWQVSDKQIRQQQQALINSLSGVAGGALGSLLGSAVCGAAPVAIAQRSGIVKTNPMALAMLKEISEFHPLSGEIGEIWEEAYENIKLLIGTGGRVAAQIAFTEYYKNIRKIIKDAAKLANLKSVFPWLGDVVEKWGEDGAQAWSFAIGIENLVESIKDDNIRNFVEEFIEELMDSCQESLMIVSYAL